MPIPRTDAELAARDRRTIRYVLAHPISSGFPKHVTDVLARIADADHDIPDADVSRLVLAALAVVVGAEICAGREAAR